jgi:hypothetical protein
MVVYIKNFLFADVADVSDAKYDRWCERSNVQSVSLGGKEKGFYYEGAVI